MGTARIARKNSRAINNSCTSNCIVTAVASRDSSKAREFVVDNIMPEIKDSVTIYSSYNDLIKSDDVCDAIYIPLPTKLHKEYVIQALKAGKHVLVEKPVATSALEYQELIDTAKTCGKYLQDGTMFVHNPRFGHFLDTIGDEDKFGTVDRINSDFSFRGDEHFFKNDIRCKAVSQFSSDGVKVKGYCVIHCFYLFIYIYIFLMFLKGWRSIGLRWRPRLVLYKSCCWYIFLLLS